MSSDTRSVPDLKNDVR